MRQLRLDDAQASAEEGCAAMNPAVALLESEKRAAKEPSEVLI
jgi:hypothetical protein